MSDKWKFRLLFAWCVLDSIGGGYYAYKMKLHEDWFMEAATRIMDGQIQTQQRLSEIKAMVEKKDE